MRKPRKKQKLENNIVLLFLPRKTRETGFQVARIFEPAALTLFRAPRLCFAENRVATRTREFFREVQLQRGFRLFRKSGCAASRKCRFRAVPRARLPRTVRPPTLVAFRQLSIIFSPRGTREPRDTALPSRSIRLGSGIEDCAGPGRPTRDHVAPSLSRDLNFALFTGRGAMLAREFGRRPRGGATGVVDIFSCVVRVRAAKKELFGTFSEIWRSARDVDSMVRLGGLCNCMGGCNLSSLVRFVCNCDEGAKIYGQFVNDCFCDFIQYFVSFL